jgi:hypothetical protein
VYEIIWKNIAEPDKSQMRIWRMRIACWMPKAVIIIAFPLLQWLPERASMLRFDVITSLVSLEHGVYGWEKVTSQ